jgi:hypothetical protein
MAGTRHDLAQTAPNVQDVIFSLDHSICQSPKCARTVSLRSHGASFAVDLAPLERLAAPAYHLSMTKPQFQRGFPLD